MPEALSHDIIAAAMNLTAPIRAACDELDAGRRLPPSLVEALASAGCLQRRVYQLAFLEDDTQEKVPLWTHAALPAAASPSK